MSFAARRQRFLPDQLVERVRAVVDSGKKASSPWSTGISALDRAIGGGIPRGRITELTGPLAIGKSAIMRQVIVRILNAGHWVAWIDAMRTLAPAPWVGLGNRFVVIRPSSPSRAAWTADILLRSGVFGLVVIDGAPPLSRVHGLRLSQLARDRDAACVVLDNIAFSIKPRHRLTGTLRLHVSSKRNPSDNAANSVANSSTDITSARAVDSAHNCAASIMGNRARTSASKMYIAVEKGGSVSNRHLVIEVDRVSSMAHRLCTHPEVPDRRGMARSTHRPWSSHSINTQQSVAGGGIGIVTHDLYGIGVPGPIHFATAYRGITESADTNTNTNTRIETCTNAIAAVADADVAST